MCTPPQATHQTSAAQQQPRASVLVVDDEPTIAEVVARYLERAGYETRVAGDGAQALALSAQRTPDLVVLDVMLPGIDGLEVMRRLQEEAQREQEAPGSAQRAGPPVSATRVILLTARGRESERIVGLRRGADDYVVKPFSPGELVARVEAVLRRERPGAAVEARPKEQSALVFEGLRIEPATRRVLVTTGAGEAPGNTPTGAGETPAGNTPNGAGETPAGGTPDGDAGAAAREVALTVREFDLLAFLARHPGQVFSRDRLMESVWGLPDYTDCSTVTVHIRRLRAKLEPDAERPRYVQTVWGVGYRFRP
jgi:two-component system response regulator ResD